jgi:hypothetical protein
MFACLEQVSSPGLSILTVRTISHTRSSVIETCHSWMEKDSGAFWSCLPLVKGSCGQSAQYLGFPRIPHEFFESGVVNSHSKKNLSQEELCIRNLSLLDGERFRDVLENCGPSAQCLGFPRTPHECPKLQDLLSVRNQKPFLHRHD